MKKNLLEWIVFGASLLLILFLLGYLSLNALQYSDSPPDIRMSIVPEQDKLNRNIYRIEVVNLGEQTAENVAVEVSLEQDGQELETAETSFPLAPKKSVQKAWVTFKAPKHKAQKVKGHVKGYNQP